MLLSKLGLFYSQIRASEKMWVIVKIGITLVKLNNIEIDTKIFLKPIKLS